MCILWLCTGLILCVYVGLWISIMNWDCYAALYVAVDTWNWVHLFLFQKCFNVFSHVNLCFGGGGACWGLVWCSFDSMYPWLAWNLLCSCIDPAALKLSLPASGSSFPALHASITMQSDSCSFLFFNVTGCFARRYVCIPHKCLVPLEARKGVKSPETGVPDSSELLCGCWEPNLHALK